MQTKECRSGWSETLSAGGEGAWEVFTMSLQTPEILGPWAVVTWAQTLENFFHRFRP